MQRTPLSTHWAPRKKIKKGTIFFGHSVLGFSVLILSMCLLRCSDFHKRRWLMKDAHLSSPCYLSQKFSLFSITIWWDSFHKCLNYITRYVSCEANCLSACKKIPRLIWILNYHYRFRKTRLCDAGPFPKRKPFSGWVWRRRPREVWVSTMILK
jgi:hypothetical protein